MFKLIKYVYLLRVLAIHVELSTKLLFVCLSLSCIQETVAQTIRANKLSPNLSKTNRILFRSNSKAVPQEICKLIIDNIESPQVNSVKFLWVHVCR